METSLLVGYSDIFDLLIIPRLPLGTDALCTTELNAIIQE